MQAKTKAKEKVENHAKLQQQLSPETKMVVVIVAAVVVAATHF